MIQIKLPGQGGAEAQNDPDHGLEQVPGVRWITAVSLYDLQGATMKAIFSEALSKPAKPGEARK